MARFRVLVFEQFTEGHHSQYLRCLIPGLKAIPDLDVVVALPQGALQTTEFREQLAEFQDQVRFEAEVPPADVGLNVRERGQLFRNLRDAVDRFAPDHVIVPTADAQTSGMVGARLQLRRRLGKGISSDAVIHFGLGAAAGNWKRRLRDRLKLLTLRWSEWTRLHFINWIFYQQVQQGPRALRERAALLPDPIPANPGLSREDSRRRLGLPEDGRYVGMAGLLDQRKAIPELLQAFRTIARDADDRLLLAGRLAPPFQQLIDREYAQLVRRRQIIVLNRFLTPDEFTTVLSALDLVCTPYPEFRHLSGNLLHGIAAGRPILANDCGWSAEMVRTFQLGSVCDVLNPGIFAETLRQLLAESVHYQPNEATRRLLEFHQPENFAHCLTEHVRSRLGLPKSPATRSWEWVMGGLKAAEPTAPGANLTGDSTPMEVESTPVRAPARVSS